MGLIERTGQYGIYWGNTYDSSQPLTSQQMEVNAEYIWDYLENEGWTLNSVCRNATVICKAKVPLIHGRWQSDIVEPQDPTRCWLWTCAMDAIYQVHQFYCNARIFRPFRNGC